MYYFDFSAGFIKCFIAVIQLLIRVPKEMLAKLKNKEVSKSIALRIVI
jgi:hypothetical protein